MLRNISVLRGLIPFNIETKYHFLTQYVGYKSQYSIDKLYPNSNLDFASDVTVSTSDKNAANEFSGQIPIDQLDISYCKSSGPGGQHVNKAATKVQVRFNVEKASWIPSWIKPKLFEKEKGRITKGGDFIVTSEKTRKQMLNQADCMDKIREAVRLAGIKPVEPSVEDIAIKNQRLAKAKVRTLKEKRSHSLKKQNRQAPGVGGL